MGLRRNSNFNTLKIRSSSSSVWFSSQGKMWVTCRMFLSGLIVFSLLGVSLGDKPSSGYGAPSIPQVKYRGPMVYSAEKPPVIHFPPPPADKLAASYRNNGKGGGGGGGKPPAVKYVPLPHHELPVLIYQSDSRPPIHVVHTPRPAAPPQPKYVPKQTYQEPKKVEYKKKAPVAPPKPSPKPLPKAPKPTAYAPPRTKKQAPKPPKPVTKYNPPKKPVYNPPKKYPPPKQKQPVAPKKPSYPLPKPESKNYYQPNINKRSLNLLH